MLLWQARSALLPEALALYLRAAHGFIRQENWDAAELALGNVDPELLGPTGLSAYQLAAAELAIQRGELLLAEKLLADVAASLRPSRDAFSTYRPFLAMAKLCAVERNFICAAHRLMDLQPPEVERQTVHDLLWSYMSLAPGLSARRQVKLQTGRRLGWWELKSSMLDSFSSSDQRTRLERWRSKWSDHPAFELLPTKLLPLNDQSWQPQHVALLLPLRGPLARAGRAVRDGFIAAYLQGPAAASQRQDFRISVYDSAASPLPGIYEEILASGVDLIVGPLSKRSLSHLNDLNPELPVLGLNYLEDHLEPAENLLQMGLAIEDETDTLVDRLLTDGVDRLLIFHNREDWSVRAAARLKAQWPFHITVQAFDDIKTITESVGRAMQVDASSERHAALTKLLNLELEFLPRARDDVEAIVALVSNLEATALVPALRFHFANNLPVYASSQSVRSDESQSLDALNGFRVCELPWQLFDDPLYEAMSEVFMLHNNSFAALYALGVDAFRVSDRLPTFTRNSSAHLLGSTGILSLGHDRRFRRELAWGVVIRGKLVALPLLTEPERKY
ncbi:MAG: penicillin-binding protein activator [Gammaproteobacteria bacterium]|nr:penicillin-binding protein activator [Gammaproteobacteria bacterium]